MILTTGGGSMPDLTPCPRCGQGYDTDGDGNCPMCAKLSDAQVRAVLDAAIDLRKATGMEAAPASEVALGNRIVQVDWESFRDSGTLWFVNRILHVFGWVIVFVADRETGVVTAVYPARTNMLGFVPEADDDGQRKFLDNIRRFGPLP